MKNTLLLAGLLTALNLSAQSVAPRILCGNEVFSHVVKQHYPALQDAIQTTFEATQAQAKPNAASNRTGPVNINVVVHVVWKDAAENLPDSVILNQIAVLNRDFNRENADTSNLRDVFVPAAGNPQIRFTLAALERVQTSALFEMSLDGTDLLANLKHNSDGGSDAWDPTKYLNIWVCKIQPLSIGGLTLGQILGFAFPPAGLDNWPDDSSAPTPEEDGVVIDFRVFGANNPNIIENPGGGGNLVVKGRTTVHEVGHYLGLRHIWGDGGIFGLPNSCDQSDGIEDTPFANAQSEFDCNTSKNTCATVETFYGANVPDMVENYMDYSSEACQNTFTKGQAAHMNATLSGPRAGLLSDASAVSNLNAKTSWTLVPNPVTDLATISLHQLTGTEPFEVRVMDVRGSVLVQLSALQSQMQLSTEALENGLYFVQLQRGKEVSTKKLVVQH